MKRSRQITLTLLASVSVAGVVSACGDEPAPRPSQDVAVTSAIYNNLQECKADGNTDEACNQLLNLVNTAPRFSSQQSCEDQFGPQACAPRSDSSGNSFFGPMMMGYMLGSLGNGSAYDYDRDYYRYRNSDYYRRDRDRTYSGYYGGSGGRYTGSSRPVPESGRYSQANPPVKATPVQPPASVRGGFNSTSDKAVLNRTTSPRALNAGRTAPKATATRGYSSRGGFGGSSRGFSSGG